MDPAEPDFRFPAVIYPRSAPYECSATGAVRPFTLMTDRCPQAALARTSHVGAAAPGAHDVGRRRLITAARADDTPMSSCFSLGALETRMRVKLVGPRSRTSCTAPTETEERRPAARRARFIVDGSAHAPFEDMRARPGGCAPADVPEYASPATGRPRNRSSAPVNGYLAMTPAAARCPAPVRRGCRGDLPAQ